MDGGASTRPVPTASDSFASLVFHFQTHNPPSSSISLASHFHNHRYSCRIFANYLPQFFTTYAFDQPPSPTLYHSSSSIVVIYCFRPTPINRNLPSFGHGFLSRTTPRSISIPQTQSCQTSTTALPTMPLLCSRTLTLLTTTTVALAVALVCLRRRMPTVNSNSRPKEVPKSFLRPLPTTHTSGILKLPRVSNLKMTRFSALSTS